MDINFTDKDIKNVFFRFEKDDDGDLRIYLNGVFIAYFCSKLGKLMRINVNDGEKHTLEKYGLRFDTDNKIKTND